MVEQRLERGLEQGVGQAIGGYRPPEARGVPHPVRRSPLDAYASDFSSLGPRLRAVERPFRTMLDVRFDVPGGTETTDAARPRWSYDGLTLPEPLRASGLPDRGALWLGPGWYLLVLGPRRGTTGPPPELEALRAGAGWPSADGAPTSRGKGDRPVSVEDVSAWRTIVDLTGPRALPVLRTGCSLDLRPDAFPPGACAQTLLARSPVVLHRLPDEALEPSMRPGYRVFVRASYAQHFATWLLDATDAPD